jgi:gamma-D-glutamyl-L-lysine dipeptidyl-peptidase
MARTANRLIEAASLRHAPDFRSAVFDVRAELEDGHVVLRGEATDAHAVAQLVSALASNGVTAVDRVTRLPELSVDGASSALVRSALAPTYSHPRLPGTQISQVVLGMRVELLSREADWLRIRGEDGYIGWAHCGYLQPGPDDWAFGWERGTTGEPVVSLGADLVDEDGRVVLRLPWGARLLRHTGAYQVPDGRRGDIAHGEVVDVDRLADRFPPRGESVARTARRWLGAPYVWGGVTLHGVDCSGFTQAVMWMHGVALPRDSDLQAAVSTGSEVDPATRDFRPGDLLFFAEAGQRVSHVAISLGGAQIIHSALGNGGVALNDIDGDLPLEERLRGMLVRVRRLLPD